MSMPMTGRPVSRRAFLAGLGGVVTAAASMAALARTRGCATTPGPASRHAGASVGYVDHNGWMLTVADAQKLKQ